MTLFLRFKPRPSRGTHHRKHRISGLLRPVFSQFGRCQWKGRAGLMALAMLTLTACGTPASYTLEVRPDAVFSGRPLRGALMIAEPAAITPYDGDHIIIRASEDQLAYLGGAQWTAPLPELAQNFLVSAFEKTKALPQIVRPGMVYAYMLSTDIQHFEIDVPTGLARVELTARLINSAGKVIAAKEFRGEWPASATANGAAAEALDAAFSQVAQEIIQWTESKI